MKLTELDPHFLKVLDPTHYQWEGIQKADADGIAFLCPKCFSANGGPVGTHSVICWRPNVPQTIGPMPGRWEMDGTGFDDLTLRAGSSSVQLLGGCNAHFFIKNGGIEGA